MADEMTIIAYELAKDAIETLLQTEVAAFHERQTSGSLDTFRPSPELQALQNRLAVLLENI